MRTLSPLLATIMALSVPLIAAEDATATKSKKTTPVVAVYDLEGQLSENGKGSDSLFSFETERPLTLFELSKSLGRARSDEAVKGVVLDVDGAALDFSQIQEIRNHLLAIRKAGKDVWLYTENLANGTAMLGSAANHFTLMPEADCNFRGIYAESLYYKGLLDKVGIRADVIHIGDFKSYGETYYRSGPSDYAKQQQDQLIDSIFAQLVDNVASGRNLSADQIRSLIDDGSLTPTKAVQAGLADHAMYRTDLVKLLRATYGKDAKFDRNYQLPDRSGPEIEGVMDVVKLMFQSSKATKSTKDFVAVVTLEGDISDESIASVRSQILKLVKDDKAKALVLRVNSPGGSALASEVLWEAIDEWNQTKRPYVASMGGVAASGGYYVACGANRIFAEPGTITGSIGVVGMKLVLGEAMAKVGITSHATQRGKNAGLASMTHGYTADEAATIRQSMEEVYGTFKKRVTDGRGQALKGDLEALAGGRVYSGKDALANGLVDELGGLTDAIIHAKRMAEGKLETRFLPEPKSLLEGMFAKPEKNDDEIIRAGGAPSPTPAAALRAVLAGSGLLETLPPATRRGITRLANRLEAFKNTRILMLGPDLDLNW